MSYHADGVQCSFVESSVSWTLISRLINIPLSETRVTNPFSRTASLTELRWRRGIKSVYGELQHVQSKLAFDKQMD